MEDVHGIRKCEGVDDSIGIPGEVSYDFQDTSTAESAQRLGVGMVLPVLGTKEREAQATARCVSRSIETIAPMLNRLVSRVIIASLESSP